MSKKRNRKTKQVPRRQESPKAASPRRAPIRAQVLDSAGWSEDNAALWQFAYGGAADEIANEGTRTLLRNRCRSEFLNNGTAAAASRNLATYGIGKGPDLQIVGEEPDAAAHLEWEFYPWAKEIGLWRKLRTVAEARYYDGESFLRWFHDPFVDDVELNIDLIDPARITTPYTSLQDEYLLDGIRYDKYNRPVAYAVMKTVPNPLLVYSMIDPEWVAGVGRHEPGRRRRSADRSGRSNRTSQRTGASRSDHYMRERRNS